MPGGLGLGICPNSLHGKTLIDTTHANKSSLGSSRICKLKQLWGLNEELLKYTISPRCPPSFPTWLAWCELISWSRCVSLYHCFPGSSIPMKAAPNPPRLTPFTWAQLLALHLPTGQVSLSTDVGASALQH